MGNITGSHFVPRCNVELFSYGLTICTERNALLAALAYGLGSPKAITFVGPGHEDRPISPCGACRQVIWELAPGAIVLWATPDGCVERWTGHELLPAPFGPDLLKEWKDS